MICNKMDCPICFETIRKPYVFKCNHSICKPCYRNMIRKGQTIIYDISMVNHPFIQEFELKKIECPLCRQNNLNKTQAAYMIALNKCFPGFVDE